jgi:hypothetical protein
MTKIVSLLTLLFSVLAYLLPAAPAQATQRDRVFVASYGSDSNACTFGSPCKTFQNAVNVVAAGGEVTAIDSAGFGTFTISHAITITSPNGVEAGIAAPANGGSAITINAMPGDNIILNGLTLDGDGVGGSTGISFNSGESLNIQNCVVRNFGTGISSSSQLTMSNSLVTDNAGDGVFLVNTGGAAILDHVAILNNVGDGLRLNADGGTFSVSVSNSVISSNGSIGIEVLSNTTVVVGDSTIAEEGTYGIYATDAGSQVWLRHSTITGNSTGWGVGSGTVSSFGDNAIVGNASGNSAPPLIAYE